MKAVIVWRGNRADVTVLEDGEADVMYDVAAGSTGSQRVALFTLEDSTFDVADVVSDGIVPEVVEVEPVDAVPVGPGTPQALPPPATPRPAVLTRCQRCKRQLIGGVCSVHGKDIYRA